MRTTVSLHLEHNMTLSDQNLLIIGFVACMNSFLLNDSSSVQADEKAINQDSFLRNLRRLLQNYSKKFLYENDIVFDIKSLIELVNKHDLGDVISFRENEIYIKTTPNKFEERIGEVIVSAVNEYIQYLVDQANAMISPEAQNHEFESKVESNEKEKSSTGPNLNIESAMADAEAKSPVNSPGRKVKTTAEPSSISLIPSEDIQTHENVSNTDKSLTQVDIDSNLTATKENGSRDLNFDEEMKNSESESSAVLETKFSEADSSVLADGEGEISETEKKTTKQGILKPSTSSAQHKKFQNISVNLIDNIMAHRFSSPFLQAVNSKEAPDYNKIIYQPKDLKSILKSVKMKKEPPRYSSLKDLERDIMLMLANCVMYNQSNSDLVRLTRVMKEDVHNLFKLFEEADNNTK